MIVINWCYQAWLKLSASTFKLSDNAKLSDKPAT